MCSVSRGTSTLRLLESLGNQVSGLSMTDLVVIGLATLAFRWCRRPAAAAFP